MFSAHFVINGLIYAEWKSNLKKQAEVKAFEKEIDQLVYKLYDFTPEEIKIVEGENENADWAEPEKQEKPKNKNSKQF